MTISTTVRKAGPFIGNGSASVFTFSFRVFSPADLEVVRLTVATGVEVVLTLISHYTVVLNADQNSNPGGSIQLVNGPLSSGYILTINSGVDNLQPTDLTNQGGFYPEVITDGFDRATIQVQQLDEQLKRSLKYPVSDPALATELPPVSQRAGRALCFDSLGQPITINLDIPSLVILDGAIEFETITTMKADVSLAYTNVEVGQVIHVRRGDFSYAVRPDSASSYDFVTNGGVKLSVLPGANGYSVNAFGAIGDGVANDTDAIQSAINAANLSSGGNVVFSAGTYLISTIVLNGYKNVKICGNGAAVKRAFSSAGNTLMFHLSGGCENIEISGFSDIDGGYGSENATTGSNPVILIGDQTGGGDGGSTNQNICIRNNVIRRANWGGVVVYGRSNNSGTITPLNKDIHIVSNIFRDCAGSAVFVYKNAQNVVVAKNVVDTMAFNGLTFDTMAASDSVSSEPVNHVVVAENCIRNFGKTGQGSGILIKGAISNVEILSNSVTDGLVQPSGSFINYGILVNKDANNNSSSDITIAGNTVSRIKSTLSGLGIIIGAKVERATVTGNTVFNCSGAGIQVLDGVSSCTITGNVVEQAGDGSYGYRFEGFSGSEISNLVVSGNIFKKSSSTAVGGFKFDYVNNLTQIGNISPDFTASAVGVTNCTYVRSLREFSAAAAPTTGTYAQGDIVTNPTTTTINPVDRWRCVVAGSPGTWRPVSWMVGRASTANRPTLSASDVGVTFLDTTLDADGKPIWWNGSAWVDATGATV